MSEPVSSSLGLQSCPACGASLERGFLLAKHNRIRWSSSPEAMTIFAGVPLVTLKRGFWRGWRWWLFAPSILAVRCLRCKSVMFHYDNAATENPRKEGIASAVMGALILIFAVFGLVTMAWIGWGFPPILHALFLLILLPVCGVGALFLIHGLRKLPSNNGHSLLLFLSLWAVCCACALADDNTDNSIADSALRETRDIISRELFGHYDLTTLSVLRLEGLQGRVSLGHDYGLVRVALRFSAKRNPTKHPTLNPSMFAPGSAMCQGWLYLHCGVPIGHVFEGTLDLLLAIDRDGSWRAVSPHWRSRRQYPLHGYLVLEGRDMEGYVLFPKQPGR